MAKVPAYAGKDCERITNLQRIIDYKDQRMDGTACPSEVVVLVGEGIRIVIDRYADVRQSIDDIIEQFRGVTIAPGQLH